MRSTSRLFPAQAYLGAVLTLAAGMAIAWMDTRPGWDDAGITAGALLISAAAGSLFGVWGWVAAILSVGPLVAAEVSGSSGVLLAVPFALAGAYAGVLVRRLMLGG